MTVSENLHTAAKEQLAAFVNRIENLEEQKAEIAADIKAVYDEARGNGHDAKALKKVIALRRQDETKRLAEESMVAVYMHALGMIADLPLGQAAIARSGNNSRSAGSASGQTERSPATDVAADVETARHEGDTAARNGHGIGSSPYISSDPRGKAWEEGYIGANAHASVAA